MNKVIVVRERSSFCFTPESFLGASLVREERRASLP
jgi:hypothetical protein